MPHRLAGGPGACEEAGGAAGRGPRGPMVAGCPNRGGLSDRWMGRCRFANQTSGVPDAGHVAPRGRESDEAPAAERAVQRPE
jgi:hypothetical protein